MENQATVPATAVILRGPHTINHSASNEPSEQTPDGVEVADMRDGRGDDGTATNRGRCGQSNRLTADAVVVPPGYVQILVSGTPGLVDTRRAQAQPTRRHRTGTRRLTVNLAVRQRRDNKPQWRRAAQAESADRGCRR